MFMSSCANGKEPEPMDSFYSCAEPEDYPDNPDMASLIYALNDTYLAWEECHSNLARLRSSVILQE